MRHGNSQLESVLITGAFGYILVLLCPKRSRHIPLAVKQRVAKRDLPAGGKLKHYHFDHRWPFALAEAARKTISG